MVNTITNTFDAASRMTGIGDNFATYNYTLDALGRATSISHFVSFAPFVVNLSQSFDAASNRTGLEVDIGGQSDFVNSYTFDGLNRNTQITQSAQGTGSGFNTVAEKRVDFAYNALGQFSEIERFSNLAGTSVVANSTYGYDALARLTSLAHTRANATSINTYAWVFDSLNRIDTFTSADGTTDFDYDVTSQLTSANHSYQSDENYTYDLNGNRVENGQVTGADNRLLNDGTYTYEYDLEGNRAKRTEIATGQYVQYVWDHRNRLTDVLFKSAANLLTKEVEYTYDVFDHRIGKRVDDNGDGVFDRAEAYVWDGLDVVLDFVDADGDGSSDYELATRRLFASGVDQVLAEENALTSAVDWLLADNQGTIRDVVNSAGQLLTGGHFVYDSFGRIIVGDLSLIRHLYTAQEYDVDISLYNYNARWYDAVTHIFVSADPIKDGVNWYAYVGNNSPNATDPSGLWPWDDWIVQQEYGYFIGDPSVLSQEPEPPPRQPIRILFMYPELSPESAQALCERAYMDPGLAAMPILLGREAYDIPRETNSLGQPGFIEGMVPVWGSTRSFIDHAQNGELLFASGDIGMEVFGALLPMELPSPRVVVFTADLPLEVAGSTFDASGRLIRNGRRPVEAQLRNNICGPTSVDMILDPSRQFTRRINLWLSDRGVRIDRLSMLLNQNGVRASWRTNLTLDQLEAATRLGNPAIASIRNSDGTWHAVVVDGITTRLGQRVVAIRDPNGGQQYFLLITEFMRLWNRQAVVTY